MVKGKEIKLELSKKELDKLEEIASEENRDLLDIILFIVP